VRRRRWAALRRRVCVPFMFSSAECVLSPSGGPLCRCFCTQRCAATRSSASCACNGRQETAAHECCWLASSAAAPASCATHPRVLRVVDQERAADGAGHRVGQLARAGLDRTLPVAPPGRGRGRNADDSATARRPAARRLLGPRPYPASMRRSTCLLRTCTDWRTGSASSAGAPATSSLSVWMGGQRPTTRKSAKVRWHPCPRVEASAPRTAPKTASASEPASTRSTSSARTLVVPSQMQLTWASSVKTAEGELGEPQPGQTHHARCEPYDAIAQAAGQARVLDVALAVAQQGGL